MLKNTETAKGNEMTRRTVEIKTNQSMNGYRKCECGMYLDHEWMQREPSALKAHKRVFHK